MSVSECECECELLTVSPQRSALTPQPSALVLSSEPSALNSEPSALSPQPSTLGPQLWALSSEPSALSSEPSAASQPASAPAGPNVPQVLPKSTLELKVRRFHYDLRPIYTAPATRTIFGSQGALIAPKRVLSAQTRFGALRTPKNVGHV